VTNSSALRALVVDDEIETTRLMTMILEREGHIAVAASSGEEALELAERHAFDVVLTDVEMGAIDGVTICERIVAAHPGTAVVVFTGHGSIDVVIRALRAGAEDFLVKPIEAESLALMVASLANRRNVIHPRAANETALERRINGSSATMSRVRDLVARIAPSDASVLVQGETGTGKEGVARAIHEASGRTGAFVAINCAAVPGNLLESELFGHVRGAYTDARSTRTGLFAEARQGTIFLDEIADLPLDIQPKLLRALQERRVRPVGANAEIAFDARVICATHRNLEDEVRKKRFREDLLYRVDVIKVHLPALRERGQDVIELANRFLADIAARKSTPAMALSLAAAHRLLAYSWPGNVRELENCMERAAVVARSREIRVVDLPDKVREACGVPSREGDDGAILTLAELERGHVERVILRLGGNKAQAARMLGMDRKTLYRKLERWARKAPAI
jgi:DNA-binding NtrC family response regulator